MASLRDIRTRINSFKSMQQVTRAMKMVAAAKLRRAQEQIFRTRPYAYMIGDIVNRLKGRVDPEAHPLLQGRPDVDAVLLVVVTADRGLAGAFNANIVKLTEQTINERFADVKAQGKLYLMCIGRKGREHFARRGYQLAGDFRGVFDDLKFATARAIVDEAVAGFVDGRWDEAYVIYNEFKNTISQNRIVEPFLPIPQERFLTPLMEEAGEEGRTSAGTSDMIFEPDPSEIIDIIVPRYLNYQMWRVLLESNASEQGARMVAMDNATSNADELLRDLRLKYNRARQDAITKELIEIVSGANALAAG
ncbi:MAG TPA: ATP synthase F1 subunit gamma [Rhodothermales bacterium]|nr:ATP synthase F1 subunit gamma [Rhodothermales bacterium]